MHILTFVTSRFQCTQKRLLRLLFPFVLALTLSPAMAGKTLIILSSDSAPYVNAAAACEEQLNASGVITERILLANLKNDQIKLLRDPVICIGGRASAKLARELPPSIFLYYCMTPRPEKIGLPDRPNTNGISTEIDIPTQINIILSGIPSVKKIGLLYRSSSPASTQRIETLRLAFPSDWEIISVDLDKKKSASKGIKELLKKNVDLVWTDPDTSVFNSATIKSLLLESLRAEVPVFGFSHALVRAGATFGTRISSENQGKRVALLMTTYTTTQAHHSAEPELVINLIAAKRIKLNFTNTFIRTAESVFR